jgi:serine/threonine protein kinase/formylglycine-generating enzyme required for sulfatase activity
VADFKTALETLASGELSIEAFSKQLTKLLDQTPQHATRMLSQLDEIHGQKKINDQIYARLKSQINQYRRTHTGATEGTTGGGDATVFDTGNIPRPQTDSAKTQVASDKTTNLEKTTQLTPDKTQVLDSSGGDTDTAAFDITGGTGMTPVDIDFSDINAGSPVPSITASTAATGTGWSDPASSAQAISSNMGPGSIIKHRFKLLEVLGVGGMGKVYKGIDLLKEEARDKNPYVAIKLLNDDFRDHPEAFISLQRESSRQQKLAHPNIATVYDFDRLGGPGTPVYITMELMEGMPLNEFIKKTVKKQNGLPFKDAFDIIKQLGAALAYAHERRLVHSDFKPGNAFLCKDGTVKTLDFGIARAVKNPVTGEGEKTLFDPGKLGALTPAYASLEMLQGEEPDTRDDTYALGCVAYELLTGKHPFNKLPADKAMENKLVPPSIKGLKKKQNRALRRSVAFLRKDRPANVGVFLEELEAKYIWYKHPLTVAAVILFAVGIGAIGPVMNYYHKQEIDQIITDIKSGNTAVLISRLAMIEKFEKAEQLTITSEAKDAIQEYFKAEINKYIDTSKDDYSFPKAYEYLAKINAYYSDSSFLLEQKEVVTVSQKRKLAELYGEFSAALADPTKLGNTKGILETIRVRIDPQNPLLTDPRPSNQYRVLADDAFTNGNFDQAMAMVKAGLVIAPQEQTLKDTQAKIERAIKIAGLQQKIGVVQGQLAALADYKKIQADIIDLATLHPDDPLITSLSSGAKSYIDQAISGLGSRAEAEKMATEYGDLMVALRLDHELTQVKLAHLSGEERTKVIKEIVANDNAAVKNLLAKPLLDDDQWKSKMLASVTELDSLSGEDASITKNLSTTRENIAQLYIAQVKETLGKNRFDAANNFIDIAERFAPGLNTIKATRDNIVAAKQTFDKQIKVDGLKKDFKGQIDGNQIVKALQYFEQLKAEAPQDDFVTKEAPVLIASSYRTLAKSRFESKAYPDALKLIDEGLKYHPGDNQLTADRKAYVLEANISELDKIFKSAIGFDTEDVRRKLGEIEQAEPVRASGFKQKAVNDLADRINKLKTSDQSSAGILAQNAAIVFPGTVLDKLKEELKPQPWPEAGAAQAALTAGKLSAAAGIQQAAAANFTNHPEFAAFSQALTAKKAEALQVFEQFQKEKTVAGEDYEKLNNAKKLLTRAQSLWTDNPDYDTAEQEINKLIAANSPASKKVIQREVVNLEAQVATVEKPGEVKKEWKPTDSGHECNTSLAGYGKRAKAICFDLVNDGWRGPLMVVVPAGDNGLKPFAIGKYEISVGDYSKYCALTNKCKPVTDRTKFDEPQTGISLKDAEDYAKWLSERTGKSYRLPNKTEWEYAAKANGEQTKDFNCRVALGDKIIKGTGIVSVTSGQQNGWGLKNYIGNVQEWVIDGSNVKVIGGAYEDSHSKCDLSLEKSHNGQADGVTGFRLVLDGIG